MEGVKDSLKVGQGKLKGVKKKSEGGCREEWRSKTVLPKFLRGPRPIIFRNSAYLVKNLANLRNLKGRRSWRWSNELRRELKILNYGLRSLLTLCKNPTFFIYISRCVPDPVLPVPVVDGPARLPLRDVGRPVLLGGANSRLENLSTVPRWGDNLNSYIKPLK